VNRFVNGRTRPARCSGRRWWASSSAPPEAAGKPPSRPTSSARAPG
jgi:hypothetical protein